MQLNFPKYLNRFTLPTNFIIGNYIAYMHTFWKQVVAAHMIATLFGSYNVFRVWSNLSVVSKEKDVFDMRYSPETETHTRISIHCILLYALSLSVSPCMRGRKHFASSLDHHWIECDILAIVSSSANNSRSLSASMVEPSKVNNIYIYEYLYRQNRGQFLYTGVGTIKWTQGPCVNLCSTVYVIHGVTIN